MSSDEGYTTDDGEGAGDTFALHDAAEAGDVELLKQLLAARREQLMAAFDEEGCGGGDGEGGAEPMDEDAQEAAEARRQVVAAAISNDPLISLKDSQECTPLHLAIINGHAECARVLVEAKSRLAKACDGCPPLIMAVCTAAVKERAPAALELVQLLLDSGADVMQRDDMERTALHWAAEVGLAAAVPPLLSAGAAAVADLARQQREDAEAAAAAIRDAGGDPSAALPDFEAPPHLVDIPDTNGDLPLHLAAKWDRADVVAALLVRSGDGWDGAAAAAVGNKAKDTPLHAAARAGARGAAAALLAAAPAAAEARNKHGFTPADLAERRGHAALAALLRRGAVAANGAAAAPADAAAAAARAAAGGRTLLMSPPECSEHYTCPQPVTRAGREPPPENTERLAVLVAEGRGSLRAGEFEGRLEWRERVDPAPMGDLLRVHDWEYLRTLQAACATIPDAPSAIGHLDGDTAISHRTFAAARAAAAAVCEAVDAVVAGSARNAFCAVRPPGHHAGPRGVVPSANDPNGSHGFCLVNNVAVGAAYAVNVHRRAGIKRVAILDFDVHHGNGTEACVANTAPRTLKFPFSTPLSEGVVTHHTWKPWLGEDDASNVFFASVQGYGSKMPGSEVFVYPGSGDTADTEELRAKRAAREAARAAAAAAAAAGEAAAAAAAAAANGAANGTAAAEVKEEQGAAVAAAAGPAPSCDSGSVIAIEEDPEHEFTSTSKAPPPLDGPRIIDVGIGGPGFHPLKWRRAWRDKVLPALAKFAPDIIFISAGFDAHRKDEINFRYIGATEADYEWLTDQIVQIANRCCGGRVVSVLEGGYNLRGGIVSAFARSVAAHVRALAEPHGQAWDGAEARAERDAERRRREERAAKAAARAAKLAAAAGDDGRRHHHHHHHQHTKHKEGGGEAAAAEGGAAAAAADAGGAAEAPAAAAAADGGGRSKRRRTGQVDYVALNAQLEEEAKAAGQQ